MDIHDLLAECEEIKQPFAGMINVEGEPLNLYPDDNWGIQNDETLRAGIDSYVEEQQFND